MGMVLVKMQRETHENDLVFVVRCPGVVIQSQGLAAASAKDRRRPRIVCFTSFSEQHLSMKKYPADTNNRIDHGKSLSPSYHGQSPVKAMPA